MISAFPRVTNGVVGGLGTVCGIPDEVAANELPAADRATTATA